MADDGIEDLKTPDQTPDNSAGTDDGSTKTILESNEPPAGGAPDNAGNKGYWPEDWREHLAKGDEKLAKRLSRFGSVGDILTSYRSLEQRLQTGELKQELPEDATDEQIAEYRKANGIPETAEGYLENLPDGLVVGDDDKEMVNSFLESVHAGNADPAIVSKALGWYYETAEKQAAAQAEADKAYRLQAEDTLRAEWGAEFRGNVNSIKSFIDSTPNDENGVSLGELLMGARLGDGTTLGDNPTAMNWLLGLANEANPGGFIAPGGGGNSVEGIEARIAEIKEVMRTNRPAYNKDQKMQDEYLHLVERAEKMKAR